MGLGNLRRTGKKKVTIIVYSLAIGAKPENEDDIDDDDGKEIRLLRSVVQWSLRRTSTALRWRATPLPPPFLTLIGTYIFRVKNPSLFATLTTSVRPSTDAVIDGIDSSLVFILFDLRIHALRLSRLSSVHASAHSLLA